MNIEKVKERPLHLFSGEMVRAILDGRKTQTRLIVKPVGHDEGFVIVERDDKTLWPWRSDDGESMFTTIGGLTHEIPMSCPYGHPGERLWVKENFFIGEDLGEGWEPWMLQGDRFRYYCFGGDEGYDVPLEYLVPRRTRETHNNEGTAEHWRGFGPISSLFMPRWASRILLEITDVRVERLQDITSDDAVSEGLKGITKDGCLVKYGLPDTDGFPGTDDFGWPWKAWCVNPVDAYRRLWEQINGAGSWEENPWVWCISFKKIEP